MSETVQSDVDTVGAVPPTHDHAWRRVSSDEDSPGTARDTTAATCAPPRGPCSPASLEEPQLAGPAYGGHPGS